MEKRVRISSNIRFKKFVLPWLLILFTYLFIKISGIGHFWANVSWFITILFSVILFSLKKTEYTSNHIYFSNKKYSYKSIISFSSFDINNSTYYFFVTDSKNLFHKYKITQLGGLSYFSIFKILIKKPNTSKIPLVEFLSLLEEKSNINS